MREAINIVGVLDIQFMKRDGTIFHADTIPKQLKSYNPAKRYVIWMTGMW
jgi:hypothetical protein